MRALLAYLQSRTDWRYRWLTSTVGGESFSFLATEQTLPIPTREEVAALPIVAAGLMPLDDAYAEIRSLLNSAAVWLDPAGNARLTHASLFNIGAFAPARTALRTTIRGLLPAGGNRTESEYLAIIKSLGAVVVARKIHPYDPGASATVLNDIAPTRVDGKGEDSNGRRCPDGFVQLRTTCQSVPGNRINVYDLLWFGPGQGGFSTDATDNGELFTAPGIYPQFPWAATLDGTAPLTAGIATKPQYISAAAANLMVALNIRTHGSTIHTAGFEGVTLSWHIHGCTTYPTGPIMTIDPLPTSIMEIDMDRWLKWPGRPSDWSPAGPTGDHLITLDSLHLANQMGTVFERGDVSAPPTLVQLAAIERMANANLTCTVQVSRTEAGARVIPRLQDTALFADVEGTALIYERTNQDGRVDVTGFNTRYAGKKVGRIVLWNQAGPKQGAWHAYKGVGGIWTIAYAGTVLPLTLPPSTILDSVGDDRISVPDALRAELTAALIAATLDVLVDQLAPQPAETNQGFQSALVPNILQSAEDAFIEAVIAGGAKDNTDVVRFAQGLREAERVHAARTLASLATPGTSP